jgi:hypothetical protein
MIMIMATVMTIIMFIVIPTFNNHGTPLCGLLSEFLATDPEVLGSIPGVTRFSKQ